MSEFTHGQVRAVEKAIADTAFISIYGSNATIVNTHDTAVAAVRAALASSGIDELRAELADMTAEKEKWRIRCAEETIAWADEATENRRLHSERAL